MLPAWPYRRASLLADLRRVPNPPSAVAFVNVRQLLGTPAGKVLTEQFMEPLALLNAAGIDLARDVDTLLVCGEDFQGEKALLIVRGRFDVKAIDAAARAPGGDPGKKLKLRSEQDLLYCEVEVGDRTVYALLLDTEALAVSPSRSYLIRAMRNKGRDLPRAQQELFRRLDLSQSVAVALLVTDKMKGELVNAGELARLAPKLKAITGGLNIADGIALALRVQTTDAKATTDLGKAINDAKGLLAVVGQMNEKVKPFIDELLQTLKINADKTDVIVSFKASGEAVAKALKALK
jgi:hypothetical protein